MDHEKTRILLIEDDIVDQLAFKRLMKSEQTGYDYIIAASLKEARSRLRSQEFDVIIIDYFLGDGTAFEIFDHIIDTPIIFVTGGGDEEIAVKAMKAGAYDYLIKDPDRNYLKMLSLTVANAIRHKKAERKSRMISEAMMSIYDSVYITDGDGKILFVNKAFCETYGYTENEVIGMPYDLLWKSGTDKRKLKKLLKRVGEEGCESEFTHLRKDGSEFPVSLSLSYIKGKKEKDVMIIGVARDISYRKQTEMEKEQIRSQLIQAQKMEAIGVLTGGVAHDFNNILTAIQGCAEMAAMELEKDHPVYPDLEQIQISSRRAANLTRQLLLFSRKHPMIMKPIRLNQVFEDMHNMLQRLIGENIRIDINLDPGLWNVMADSATLSQVIMNLVVNARDAMPDGGHIKVETMNVVLDDTDSKQMVEADSGMFVCLSISDTGMGIPYELQERIFDPFFSTKEPKSGTGLGLSVAYGIVKEHAGWIQVYSEIDQGAEFKVYLPAASEETVQEPVEAIAGDRYEGEGERILLVEDEEIVRDYVYRALKKKGYEVFIANNVEQARRVFDREEGRFDLVFSDVVLPDGVGIDLVDQFQGRTPTLQVLLGSGYTDYKSRWPTIQNRGFRFLHKPYTSEELYRVIKELMDLNKMACEAS